MMPDQDLPRLMVRHAAALLKAVGYGTKNGPFLELGIDLGDAYVGNLGQDSVYDFTAVGDVVNTTSRIQGYARGGQLVVSERAAAGVPAGAGQRSEIELKGKAEPVAVVLVSYAELTQAVW